MMGDKTSIQVQAVLYRNEMHELVRALQALDNAAAQAELEGISVTLSWGDASEEELFTQQSWQETRNCYCSHVKDATYRFFHENTGYGKGNNLLAAETEAAYLLIMNPEILLPPKGITDLLTVFRNEDAGIAEARQIPVEHPKYFDAGSSHETAWASGACFMIKTSLFRELQGFDAKTFFMYCEDVDLSWRVRKAGKKIFYQPLVGVFHAKRLSGEGRHQPSQTEAIHTVLSEALLAYKWSWPEYARERIRIAAELDLPGGKEAQTAFQQLEEQGELPDFLDPEHQIGRIIQFPENGGMLFAEHRYAL